MKHLIYIFVLTLLFSCGTDQGEERKYNYSIINKSGSTIEIIPYYDGIKKIEHKISINDNNLINKTYTEVTPYQGGLTMGGFFIKSSIIEPLTQVEIVFNNSKKVVYEVCSESFNCNADPRNIFNITHNLELIEIYTITPEDYTNATDCGGDCN